MLWKIYVDDVIAIVTKSSTIDLLNDVNNINPVIQFSLETENSN